MHVVVSVKTVGVSHLNAKFSVLGKILHKSIQNTNTNTWWQKYFKYKYKYLKVIKIQIVLKKC